MAAALGQQARGVRTVAAYDQDTTTLGVEAALPFLDACHSANSLWFATTAPAYLDKTNAATVHAALQLRPEIPVVDLGTSLRGGFTALAAAARDGGLAVLADMRGGHVGGADERDGGDGAAAFLFGDDDVAAEVVTTASVTSEFLDRWRSPSDNGSAVWEERFGADRYREVLEHLLTQLISQGVDPTSVTRFAVASSNGRAVKSAYTRLSAWTQAVKPDTRRLADLGHVGAAQPGVLLADLLDAAEESEMLLLITLADGADAMVLRTTAALASTRTRTLRSRLAEGTAIAYPQYLVWRGRVAGERPRRPDPERPSAPFAWRNRDYKFALSGGRCRECGAVSYPLPPVCHKCRAEKFDVVTGLGQCARVVTATVDHLAFSPSPPLVSAVVQFGAGGRIQCELTDVDGSPAVGDEVVPTFRRGVSVDGIHNYIWKARPTAAHRESGEK
ncbi:OB-fold domain-containing protein [Rhodococcus wratislaviensis]|uniref:OB-fold domain-containing protein n=1 Tax=Rhodococcus wratislaviensis TaxID=44752 RepID=UPI0004B90143|nr:OB-fold domain-containing protein [Rhodococcus wratislaviensis]